jgi:DNA (cytosine-5)-methyltransferase 1
MNHDNNNEKITHLSLCSGYEGIGMGLRRVLPNLREIAYVEREGFCCANLESKIEKNLLDEAPIYTDVKTFPYRKFHGLVDILSGGFPCQPFSQAGLKKATDDPRHLFPYIAEGIRECQPRIVFLENVEGILSCKTADGEPVLKYVLRRLEEMGYRATAGIFSASEVGAPHQRKRVFILGLAYSENFGRRGGTHRDGDDGSGIQEQEAQEQSNFWGETERCSRDSRTELGYTEVRCDRQQPSEQQGWDTSERPSEKELGDTSSVRCSQPSEESREACTDTQGEERRLYESEGASTLPNDDTLKEGLSDTECKRTTVQVEGELTSEQVLGGFGNNWPSRPNEEQHGWEAPRVIKVEPRVGGKPYGYTSRVDRLRALGNGVVPATVAKAFSVLINRVL